MNVAPDFKPVPTRAALALHRKSQQIEFQALVFEDPSKSATSSNDNVLDKSKKHSERASQSRNSRGEPEEFDIKKARHEVLSFAMNNQRIIKNKKKMEAFQLIKMGAKPPKKAYKNYKDLLDERKRLNDIREQRKKFHQLGKNQTGAASVKCRGKTKLEKQQKKRAPVSAIDQHYGVAKPKLKKRK
ncbi:uncharacterized protein C1orf131 [Ceratitis capitata]|uniref:Uncharacterized protein n=1 Tax=Ceratitis capitata TaxID=7213 RepID=W8C245_CERCA|nr:uncharacterized protein C1orf131 [Ceratitis capitata]XP_020716797.1 uncharacterized protein C1orf131 [Ceratitis capitata]